jgi:ATP-binding cassette subfamily B protein
MPLLRRHRARIVVSLVAASLALIIQVAIPWIIGQAIDQALDARTARLWPFAVGLIALAVARGVLTAGYRYGLYGMAFKLEYALRTLLFEHLSTSEPCSPDTISMPPRPSWKLRIRSMVLVSPSSGV